MHIKSQRFFIVECGARRFVQGSLTIFVKVADLLARVLGRDMQVNMGRNYSQISFCNRKAEVGSVE